MQLKKYIYSILLLTLLPNITVNVSARQREYWVATTGCDTSKGSYDHPFLTPSRAIAVAAHYLTKHPSDSACIIFAPGIYSVRTPLTLHGISRLCIKSQQPGAAVFNGGATVSRFQRASSPCHMSEGILVKAHIPDSIPLLPMVNDTMHLELFCHGQRFHPARYPNHGFMYTGKAVGNTLTPHYSYEEGIYEYNDSRLGTLASSHDVWTHGFWCYDWEDSYQKVEHIDSLQHTFTLLPPHHRHGYKSNARFYVFGSMQLLDCIGEYHLDRPSRTLYMVVPETEDVEHLQVEMPVFKGNYMLQSVDCNNITVSGISFRNSTGAVDVQGGENNILDSCHISQMTSDAMRFNGGHGHRLQHSMVENIGGRGIAINGGDRKMLIPSGMFVSDNIFRDISYYVYTYHGAIKFTGCGLSICRNSFSNMPSSAIRVDGNDVLVEHNFFCDLVNISDDQGAFDMHKNPSFRGIELRYNYFYDIGAPSLSKVAAIRLDDMISGVLVHHNYFDTCGTDEFGAVHSFGGKDNRFYDNTFVRCPTAISFTHYSTAWAREMGTESMRKKLYEDVDISSAVYRQHYPELQDDINANIDHNYVYGNKMIDCKYRFYNSDKNTVTDNHTLKSGLQQKPDFKYGPDDNPYSDK